MDFDQGLRKLSAQRDALLRGDEAAAAAQRAKGRLTARERVEGLLDAGSFVETDAYLSQGNAVCGYGLIDQRPVYVLAQDAAVMNGAMGKAQAAKMIKVLELAEKAGAPVILMPDSAGALVQEGPLALSAYAKVFAKLAQLNSLCPLICVLAGDALGSAAHFAALSDFVIAVDKAGILMPVAPSVLNAVQGSTTDARLLGGAEALAAKGMAALTAKDEQEAFRLAARLVQLLPSSAYEAAPFLEGDELNRLVKAPQGARALVEDIADQGTMLELWAVWQKGAVTALAHVGGYSCGIVAIDAQEDEGRLDAFTCDKIARFASFCDSYDLPLITLIDSAGLAVPGVEGQAWLMTASARMLASYAQATTPKLTVITGSAVGSAYVAFAGQHMADITLAWPQAYVAPLTAEAAVQTFHAERIGAEGREALEAEVAEASDAFAAARDGLVDEVIAPAETRKHLIAALELLQSKLLG